MFHSRIVFSAIVLIVMSFVSLPAAELGDPAKLAVRFDDTTGNLSEIVYKGETVTLSGKEKQGFDISVDGQWQYGKHPVELVSMGKEKGSGNVFNVTQKFGDWQLTFRYTVDQKTATLGRSVMLLYTGKPTKIKGFWFSYPALPFEKDAKFIVPGLYPPKIFTPDNFADGAKQGIWRNSAPFAMQLDEKKSVIMMTDNLIDYADRGGADASRRDGGIRLAQSFSTLGHIKPGAPQFVGVGYLRFVDGNVETALTKIHDLMRYLGHVVPKDRPKWFESAITYSFHPGGTIGSQCKDLGGFVPATKFVERIKELGCNTIWFMPLEDKSIYWPRDYYKFQDGLGSTPEKAPEEYKALVGRAHELGMKVLQDSVPHGGSNTYQRMIDHPEWLAQEEDGSTLHYWCADFNWPTWIEYMSAVSTFYVKTYGIDGYRVDACGGSKIPNWNPAIPYARASHSQSQGGLNMLRAIRKAVKDEKPDGATLAEVNGSVFGAVSDAVYDFDLAYNVLHDSRKQTPEEFVKRLRRWLHEQQYSEIPDLLRLRHVESHDSLRAQLWYGTEPHRALMALTTFIHGIPLVYHEEETGHLGAFREIFQTKESLPELNGGEADYLCIDTSPGVFAVLRTKGDDASIVLINFNFSGENYEGSVSLPWEKLPPKLRERDSVFCKRKWRLSDDFDTQPISQIKKENGRFNGTYELWPFSWDVWILRAEKPESPKTEVAETKKQDKVEPSSPPADFLKLENANGTLYIDSQSGLPVRMDLDGIPRLGEADLMLPTEYLSKAGKASITPAKDRITVRRSFGDEILELVYSSLNLDAGKNVYPPRCYFSIDCRWIGQKHPGTSVLSIPVINAEDWSYSLGLGSELSDRFQVRHLTTDGVYGSIYWRPQGTNTFFDSLLTPNGSACPFWGPLYCSFDWEKGNLIVNSLESAPVRFRLVDRIGEKQGLSMLLSITDEAVPGLPDKPEFSVNIGSLFKLPQNESEIGLSVAPISGGWIFENDYYRLRLTRSGTVMSLDKKTDNLRAGDVAQRSPRMIASEKAPASGDFAEYRSVPGSLKPVIHQGDLYTDYGYSDKKIRYAAGNDVEAGCRIVQDGDTLRLRFEGQLRGFGRFDLMRPPVEYFTEYALNDGPAFSMACGVKTNRAATDNRAFLALMLPMPEVQRFEYFKDGKVLAEGSNVDAKGRSFQCRGPEYRLNRVVLKDARENLIELTELKGDMSNLFLDRKNFFITFDDGEDLGTPGQWRSFSTTISVFTERGSQENVPKVTPIAKHRPDSETKTSLLVDGGFEALSSGGLVSLRTGEVLKNQGRRSSSSAWQVPPAGSVVADVFRSGKSSAKVVGETAQYRHFTQDVAVKDLKPGQKLRLTAWVKGDDLKRGPESWQVGSVRFVVTADGKQQYISAPTLLGTFDWKETTVEFTVPEKLQNLSVQVGVNGAAGTIWIDDVRLEAIP